MTLLEEFGWRGLVYDSTEGLGEDLARASVTAYAGFDATGPSLHVGHLLPALALARIQRLGHRPIALVGGGTGLIGDPSGKNVERNLLTLEQVAVYAEGIQSQLSRLLDFSPGPASAQLVNNAEWLTTMTAMEFLRDVGKHFSVTAMLARDSVKRRINSEEGISYTEFSYSLMQAYDFLKLHDRFQCTLQLGGSDQWGNIVSGTDLIRRLRGVKAHGLVMPLLTTASGTKFGKTESGAVWLDPERTSPYTFYQFWLTSDDADVVRYLKFFTFLDRETIADAERTVTTAPEQRAAQRLLAQEVTRLVHGADQLARAERATAALFSDDLTALPVEDALAAFADAPSTDLPAGDFGGEGAAVVDLLSRVGLAPSKSEARRLVQGGGVSVNNRRVADPSARLTLADSIGGRLFVLKKGRQHQHVLKLV